MLALHIASNSSSTVHVHSGFLALVLQRCVLSDGVSEDLRVAGLRAASVFMARSAKVRTRNVATDIATMERRRPQHAEAGVAAAGYIKLGSSMSAKGEPCGRTFRPHLHYNRRDNSKTQHRTRAKAVSRAIFTVAIRCRPCVVAVSSAFPVISEALMQHRHDLGEPTYVALLEMALLGDERHVPWSEQLRVIGIVNAVNARSEQHTSNGSELTEGMRLKEEGGEGEELAASVWWNHHSRDPDDDRGDVQVLDDTQRIRNILPLALILQYLPAMESSVQVCAIRRPLCCIIARIAPVRGAALVDENTDLSPTLSFLLGALTWKSSVDVEAKRGKSGKGNRAIACGRGQVLGRLGALPISDDGAPLFQVCRRVHDLSSCGLDLNVI